MTREPYAYVAGNPLNGIDPGGLGWCGVKDLAQTCSTLPAGYSGQGKTCMVIGNGSTDTVKVESEVACTALGYDGSNGPYYHAFDAVDATPADQVCSFDPGTGFSHCITKPSETFNNIFLTACSAGLEVALHFTGVPETIEVAVAVADATVTVWDWTHGSGPHRE